MELSRNWHWMWSTFNYHKKYKGFFISFLIVLPKLISAVYKFIIYTLIQNKEKRDIYYQRYSGLINAIMGKDSWYRPKVKFNGQGIQLNYVFDNLYLVIFLFLLNRTS